MLWGAYLLLDDTTPDEQGEWGEQIVDHKLRKLELTKKYIYKDIYVSYNNWVYQIDHILICSKGIFVIETKMIYGKILGDENINSWTAFYQNRKTSFTNPIRQNDSHIKAISNILSDDMPIRSLIVFVRTNKPKGCPSFVINSKELNEYIMNYESDKVLSDTTMLQIKEILDDIQNQKKSLKAIHKEQLKEKRS